MANITTQFNLIDNMSPKIKNINNGLKGMRNQTIAYASVLYVFNTLANLLSKITSIVNDYTDAFSNQFEQEQKLYTIMRQRMNATKEDFLAMRELAKDIQKNGVLNDQIILKGAQELASFVQTKDELTKLLPAIADLTVQQNGVNATADQMRQITTSIGKMLNGTVSGLSKLGLAFTDEQKKMLKSNDMAQKVQLLYEKIGDKVGKMNLAMAQTPVGRMMNLKNQLQDVNEELGKMALPLKIAGLEFKLAFQTKLLDVFSKGLQWVRKNINMVTNAIVLTTRALTIAGVALVAMFAVAHPYLTLIAATIGMIVGLMDKLGIRFKTPFANSVFKFLDTSTQAMNDGLSEVEKAADGSMLVTDKNLIDIAEDYRELLSRRATQMFNLQMAYGKSMTPNINIEHVDVHKEADAESVLQTLADSLDAFSQSSLTT